MSYPRLAFSMDDLERARSFERAFGASADHVRVADNEAFYAATVLSALERSLRVPHGSSLAVLDAEDWPPRLLISSRQAHRGDLHVDSDHHDMTALVACEVSSMVPNDDWPMRVRSADVEAAEADIVLCCYVPKRPSIDVFGAVVIPNGHIVGWLSAAMIAATPTTATAPHDGHQFASAYAHFRVDQLIPMSRLDEALHT